jgi:hydrophobic/amphiphilic exporter-1 (mainly G- bacteria), HAE1 family
VSQFFINRPIVAMVIAILMVLVGGVSMLTLPIAQFPDIVPPEVTVQATYPGADAVTVEQSVATPFEQQMSGVDNMNYMYSTNASDGSMSLTVNFAVGTDPNTDQILAQIRTAQANSQLPVQVIQSGVTVQKAFSAPLMAIALHSPKGTYDNIFLANYAYINLVDQLTRVPGIARALVFGAGQYAMRCWVKPDQLARLNITVPEIINAIEVQNTVNPAGQIGGQPIPQGQPFTYTVRSQGRLASAKEFEEIILRSNPEGSILRLKDVARLERGAQTYNVSGRFNGQPAAIIALYQLPGTNALDAVEGVKQLMSQVKDRFPSDLESEVALDTTLAVTEGIRENVITVLQALVLVLLVVYVFLQSWRATLIPMLAVPVSLVGTFAVFPLLGFSINTLSLFGLVLAIGLVVDDAIVVVEAVERHIEEGMSPRDSALKAMEEVSSPVIATALILAAVFVPTAFIPGITGRLYQQFAVTIALSVIFSAFNALSLSPALAALMLKPRQPRRGPLAWFFRGFNTLFGRITDQYVGISGWLIRKSAFSLAILLAAAAGAAFVAYRVPSSFLPQEDQGYVYGALQLPDAASAERTGEAARKVEAILASTPGVQSFVTINGFSLLSGVRNSYSAFFFVTLKRWDERRAPDQQFDALVARLNGAFQSIKEGNAFLFPPPAIPGIGASGGFTFILEDRSGRDLPFLSQNVDAFLQAARKRPELAGLSTTFLPTVPQVFVNVDRAKTLQQGVALEDVFQTMQAFMGGVLVNYFNEFGRQWQVWVEAEGAYRTRVENLGQFYVVNKTGMRVPLSTLTQAESRVGPEFTLRYNEYRGAQINGAAAPGYSSRQATAALEQVFAQTMPSGMGFDYLGISFQEQKAAQGVPPALIFGLSGLFVLLILAAQYESWSLPFSVVLGVPIAVFGAYLALWLRDLENDVYAQIGLVMLIGLSSKNAILIVEYAKTGYENGQSIVDAALGAARIRLRPILMTAFAFIFGVLPLWVATGAGASSRRVLGTVVIGGMLAATLISIFLIPVTFAVVERVSNFFSPKKEVARGGPAIEGGPA